MYFQIRKVILWPRVGDYDPRIVDFELGALNVITGASKTGKSAIIPIIDYCLGSEKCAIPVETIRKACSWFGVLVETSQGQLLLARREPGNQKATGEMFVVEGSTVEIPKAIDRHNTTTDAVKVMLNDLAGLTQLEFASADTKNSFRDRPSFRDMAAFTFQPQNIIANANVLFYKADSTEHREKLRTIFPYVLGAVTSEVLALEHELHRIRFELRRKQREFETLRQISERWVSEIRGKISRARELGLITHAPDNSASVADLIGMLRNAVGNVDEAPALTSQVVTDVADELVALQREEASASTSLSRLKQRFAEMTRFRNATEEYRGSLSVRRERMQIADWMRGLHNENSECPVCGAIDHASDAAIDELHSALQLIEEQTGALTAVPAAFDREYQRVRDEIGRETERLNAVRYRHRALEGSSQVMRDRQYRLTESARFVGALDEALERYEGVAFDSELSNEISALRDRVAAIEAELQRRDVKGATSRAAQRFALLAGRVLPSLDTEWPDAPILLAIDDLTVKVSRQGRDDYLWEIGSGANWLAYHIATSIALHELFRDLGASPVPGFLVYDQPSQVYFPKYSAAADDTDAKGVQQTDNRGPIQIAAGGARANAFRDEDVTAVRNVFVTLADAVRRSKGAWQAIVLDHASDDVWGAIDGLHRVEEWRDGLKLVPEAWIQ